MIYLYSQQINGTHTYQGFKCVEIFYLVSAKIQVRYLWTAVQEL